VVIDEIKNSLSWWLEAIAKSFEGNDDAFLTLVSRVLERSWNDLLQGNGEVIFDAINHPVGHVTEATIRWWYRQGLNDNQQLSGAVRTIFTDVCNSAVSIFRHGRVLLGTNVITLFRVDREWTEENLLPLFDWDQAPNEAPAVWAGFLWSPRLHRPLLRAIARQFIETARHYSELGEQGGHYATLLTFAALEPEQTFSRSELAQATGELPVDGLERAGETLVDALAGAGSQRVEYWRNRIVPYLRFVWPKSPEALTPAVSRTFAKLCVAAGDGFPEAYARLKSWIRAVDHPDLVVHLLHEASLCAEFPDDALDLLNQLVSDNAIWLPLDLKACLDSIRSAKPSLETDGRFQRLVTKLRQTGQLQ
jgi:hypothetical protein